MILEYSVNEAQVQPAWLKTLYDLVEELNCKCRTYIDESYNRSFKQFTRTRTIEVYGSVLAKIENGKVLPFYQRI